MNGRRVVLLITGLVMAGLAGLFAATAWDEGGRIVPVVSALAAVAGVGVAVWAALPASKAGLRLSRTGKATAGRDGRANTGYVGPRAAAAGPAYLDSSGDADASAGGEANTGIHLT